MKQQTLSRLMGMSWEIQRSRNYNRSKSLGAAWAIFLNEDITVYHLVKKHSRNQIVNKAQVRHLTLF
ncbi:MAG TPA: hypothetical protein VGZ71_03170 [Puia sp.]|jgi:hypothetical protein|nr:hypothetical protein [Puia sp.]